MTEDRQNLSNLRRSIPPAETGKDEPPSVNAGAVEKVVDYVFNPSDEKLREVTSIDRTQGRLLPQLDMVDDMWQHVFEIAAYRQDVGEYERIFKRKRPVPPNVLQRFIKRTAQWQKSIGGMNLKSAIDLALAELEAKADEDGGLGSAGFGD